jgi:hypothetical protein
MRSDAGSSTSAAFAIVLVTKIATRLRSTNGGNWRGDSAFPA